MKLKSVLQTKYLILQQKQVAWVDDQRYPSSLDHRTARGCELGSSFRSQSANREIRFGDGMYQKASQLCRRPRMRGCDRLAVTYQPRHEPPTRRAGFLQKIHPWLVGTRPAL